MKKLIFIVLIVLLLAACTTGAWFLYLLPNEKVVPAFEEDKLNLVIEGNLITSKNQPKILNEEILLPIDIIKKYFDSNIYWDEKLKKVTVTTKDKVIRMKTDNLNALINNKPVTLNIPVSVDNGVVLIPIEFLADFYNIEISYLKENNVVVIDYKNSIRQIAEPISPDAVVRKGRSIHQPIVKKLSINPDKPDDSTLRVFEEYDKWYKVRTSDGTVGYIEKRFVVVRRMLVKAVPQEEPKNTAWKPDKGKITLAWDAIYSKTTSYLKESKISSLDVLSPTWFQVANDQGALINRADAKYVDWAHKNGYKVWALLSNDFQNAGMTKRFLNNTDARDNLIRQVLAYSALYKLDGINIDFENVNKEDKDALTQFMRELTPFLKEQGLVVSIDVTVPDGSDNWSLCYDRKALGQVVDYMMLMTYDQYWATSPKAGSTAQVTWVETNLKKVLDLVPREKLLLGLPFYTRLWKEETNKDGKIAVSSIKPLSMDEAKKLIKDNVAQVKWDTQSGQFYAEYKKDNTQFKIWLEDDNSIDLKSALVQKYRLAGAAAWKKGDESQAIWGILDKNLKNIDNYTDWLALNKGKQYSYN